MGYMDTANYSFSRISLYTRELSSLSKALKHIDNPNNKKIIEDNIQDICNQIDDITENTTYNGKNIFDKDLKFDINDKTSLDKFFNQKDLFKNEDFNNLQFTADLLVMSHNQKIILRNIKELLS